MPAINVRQALEQRLPAEHLNRLRQVQGAAAGARLAVYLVGGFVRDLLLGLPPGDLDIVVEAPGGQAAAGRLARALAGAHGGRVTVHGAFGTATWYDPAGRAIDFATARTETYPAPGALPVVALAASIADDLRRRDFAINAIAVRVDGEHFGEVIDPHEGQADLARRAVRVLHAASFADDPTRILRAVRYEQRLGFCLTPDTAALVPAALPIFDVVSGERVRHELDLIAREPQAPAMLARLQALGVLRALHPALRWGPEQTARAAVIDRLPLPGWDLARPVERETLYLALLLEAAGPAREAALERLAVTRETAEAVRGALDWRTAGTPLAGRRPSEVVAALNGLSEMAVVAAYVLTASAPERAALDAYVARWRRVHAATTGDDLVRAGLPPGPRYKHILWRLRAARLDGVVNDRAGEAQLLQRILDEGQ